ncbi:MAG: hypothetical protein HC880_04790, partial [Bacteroidia bacterium]|nr:hypothetical protein [Bacteroidia bacterium]
MISIFFVYDLYADVSSPEQLAAYRPLAPNWHPVKDRVLNLGISRDDCWLRGIVHNPGDEDAHFLLVLGNPSLYYARLFVYAQNQRLSVQESGMKILPRDRTVPSNQVAFTLRIPAGQSRTMYLQVQSHTFLSFPIELLSPKQFGEQEIRRSTILGAFYGILIFILLTQFLIYFVVKIPAFLYFVLYSSSLGIVSSTLDGFAAEYIAFLVRWMHGYQDLYAGMATAVFFLIFTRSFLQTPKNNPLGDRLIQVILNYMVVVVGAGLISPVWGIYSNLSGTFVALMLIFWIAIQSYHQGQREGIFFFWSYVIMSIAAIVSIVPTLLVLSFDYVSHYSIHMAYGLQILILSAGLGDKLLALRNEVARKELEKEIEKQQIIEAKNEELEDKVKQRTQELVVKEAKLVSLVESTQDVIFSVDCQYQIMVLNQAARNKFYRYDLHVDVGSNLIENLSPDSARFWKANFDRALSGESFSAIQEIPEPKMSLFLLVHFNPI